MPPKTERLATGWNRFATPAISNARRPLVGLAALVLLVFPSEAGANAPNFPMLLGTNAWLIATVPATVFIEGAVIKKFSDFSWLKSLVAACILYLISTSIGSFVGGDISFAFHTISFDRSGLSYSVVSTIIFTITNTTIEVLALLVIYRFFLGWVGLLVFFVANALTTAMLFYPYFCIPLDSWVRC